MDWRRGCRCEEGGHEGWVVVMTLRRRRRRRRKASSPAAEPRRRCHFAAGCLISWTQDTRGWGGSGRGPLLRPALLPASPPPPGLSRDVRSRESHPMTRRVVACRAVWACARGRCVKWDKGGGLVAWKRRMMHRSSFDVLFVFFLIFAKSEQKNTKNHWQASSVMPCRVYSERLATQEREWWTGVFRHGSLFLQIATVTNSIG